MVKQRNKGMWEKERIQIIKRNKGEKTLNLVKMFRKSPKDTRSRKIQTNKTRKRSRRNTKMKTSQRKR